LVGLLAGGSLRRFEHLPVHWWGMAILGLALQGVPLRDAHAAFLALLGSYVVLIAFCLVNRRLVAAPLLLLGLALNLAVVAPNRGMPVNEAAVRSITSVPETRSVTGKHHMQTTSDVVPALGDVIPVPEPFGVILSVGDVFLYAGVVVFVVSVMLGRPGENYRRPARLAQMYRGKHLPIQRRLPGIAARKVGAPAAVARSGT
jgi:hypothetical protein